MPSSRTTERTHRTRRSRSNRRKNSNPHDCTLTTTNRLGIERRASDLIEGPPRADKEPLARLGQLDAAVVTNKERGPNLILQILDAKNHGRATKNPRPATGNEPDQAILRFILGAFDGADAQLPR